MKTTKKQNTVDRGEIKKEALIKGETISIKRMFQENITDYDNTGNGEGVGPIEILQMNKMLENYKELLAERVKNIMSLVDLDGSNEEEINAIQQLIEKYAGGFGLDGEPLPVTHLITNKISISTNKPIKTKQYHYPPKLKEQLQKKID
jgi:hypothetical protein